VPRDLTATQLANVNATVTKPIYLIEWEHSGSTERLSCSGDITYNGNAYSSGAVRLTSLTNDRGATIVVPATTTRVDQICGNDWRDGICKIYYIPGIPANSPEDTYAAADGFLVLDGLINASRLSDKYVTVSAVSKYLQGEISPTLTYEMVANYMPAPGFRIEWEGEVATVDSWLNTNYSPQVGLTQAEIDMLANSSSTTTSSSIINTPSFDLSGIFDNLTSISGSFTASGPGIIRTPT